MVATCISNIASWEESIVALGPAKGNALPLVVESRLAIVAKGELEALLLQRCGGSLTALRASQASPP